MNNKSLVLLSGGLDSVVSLVCLREKFDIRLALTFDYGQKAAEKEIISSQNICEYYNITHKVINLDWLEIITNTALVSGEDVPKIAQNHLNDKNRMIKAAKSVWVPNRNALFINIAASFAESLHLNNIIIGANKEEGQTFKDNSKEFIEAVNNSLVYSTLENIQVLAPLIDLDKEEIFKLALDYEVPLQFIRSCYLNENRQCGICESCSRLKKAVISNDRKDLINLLF